MLPFKQIHFAHPPTGLTLYHTLTTFDAPEGKGRTFKNTVGKRENAGTSIFFFTNNFSIL